MCGSSGGELEGTLTTLISIIVTSTHNVQNTIPCIMGKFGGSFNLAIWTVDRQITATSVL